MVAPAVAREAESAPSIEALPAGRDARQEYFKARRLAVERLTEVRTLLGTAAPAVSAAAVNPQQWAFIGPQPMIGAVYPWSGSVLILVMDPHNSSTIYAVTFLHKLWKTTDAGTTWLPLSDAGPLVTIQWLALDPTLTNTLYAMDSGSLYKSTNGGSTWTALAPVVNNPNCSGEAFAVHPAVSGTWLVSEYCSGSSNTSVLYKTTNAGSSWTKVATVAGEINEVAFHTSTPTYAYASGYLDKAVLFETSLDTGTTWTTSIGSGSTQLPQSAQYSLGLVRFASAPTSPKTIYLRTETYNGAPVLMSLYKSTDGGATWNITGYPPDGQGPRTPALTVVDPTNANIVYAGSTYLHRSNDGGATWTEIDENPGPTALHSDHHSMIFSPDGNTIYEANDGGVWSSANFRTVPAPTWTSLNTTLGTGEFEPVFAMDPTNANRSFGGLQDNSTVQYSGALGWAEVGLGGDGNGNAINPQNPNIVYSVDDSAVHRSTAGGAPGTWIQVIPQSSGGRLMMDFTTPSTLYYKLGTTLQQTQDGGNTWPVIATLPLAIAKMAVAPSTSNTVVVVADAVPYVSNNAPAGTNATFSARLPVSAAASVNGANGIVIDPANPAKFYSLESSRSGGALLVSEDGGMSWQAKNLGPNVTDAPTDLLIDPDLPGTMYLGTDSSVFRSSDGGATWWPLASGFPIVKVTSVNLHRGARILRVATAGRAVWDLAIPTTAPRVSSASLSGVLMTVNGTNFTASSTVMLNGNALTTFFLNSKQLAASAGPIAPSTVYYVSVNTPGSGGGLTDPIIVSTGPTIYPNGLENAAGPVSVTSDSPANSFAVGLAPGTFTALYGSQLATATTVATAPYPTSLGGVKVLVNGTQAPIYFVSSSQIDFVMPWETVGTQASIQVVTGAGASNTVTAAIQTAPQIFTTNQQGSGQGAVLIAGTPTIVAPAGAFPGSRPAAKGEYISIYTTGLGAVQNQPADGAIATGLSPTAAQPAVLIGCPGANGAIGLCPATVQFTGLAPGFVGLYQVNVQIPTGALSGNRVPLQLSLSGAGGRPSNIVTIAIQ